MSLWRCELYADRALSVPCVTVFVAASDPVEADRLIEAELAAVDVILHRGELKAQLPATVEFAEGQSIKMTRYLPAVGDRAEQL
jgi:hypothetical protein